MQTTWPSSMTMGASWDVAIAREYGAACGAEQRGKGMQVMLGPGDLKSGLPCHAMAVLL